MKINIIKVDSPDTIRECHNPFPAPIGQAQLPFYTIVDEDITIFDNEGELSEYFSAKFLLPD